MGATAQFWTMGTTGMRRSGSRKWSTLMMPWSRVSSSEKAGSNSSANARSTSQRPRAG
jgi:hypothetical protein